MQRLTFQAWLEAFGGAEKLAKALDVSPRVAHRWRRAEGWPKIESILAIRKLSKGRLTLDAIIEGTWPTKKRGVK